MAVSALYIFLGSLPVSDVFVWLFGWLNLFIYTFYGCLVSAICCLRRTTFDTDTHYISKISESDNWVYQTRCCPHFRHHFLLLPTQRCLMCKVISMLSLPWTLLACQLTKTWRIAICFLKMMQFVNNFRCRLNLTSMGWEVLFANRTIDHQVTRQFLKIWSNF